MSVWQVVAVDNQSSIQHLSMSVSLTLPDCHADHTDAGLSAAPSLELFQSSVKETCFIPYSWKLKEKELADDIFQRLSKPLEPPSQASLRYKGFAIWNSDHVEWINGATPFGPIQRKVVNPIKSSPPIKQKKRLEKNEHPLSFTFKTNMGGCSFFSRIVAVPFLLKNG
jgi:hypothetical protein